jgi:hypothetical protein
MKRGLLIILVLLVAAKFVIGQDCTSYFPLKEGSVREVKNYNSKDKYQGGIVQTVKEVNNTGDKLEIKVHVQNLDKKEESYYEGEMMFTCEDGVFRMDMQSFMQANMLESMQGMELEMESVDLELPSNMKPGEMLEEGVIKVKASSNGMTIMNMVTRIYNRKVEAIETITTEAGTFECFKIVQEIEVKSLTTVNVSSINWIAEGVGMVRTESYNKKGNLTDYTVLTRLED